MSAPARQAMPPGELPFLTLAAVCPKCHQRSANLRITARQKERFRDADPAEIFGTVKCTWQEKGRICGEVYGVTVAAILGAA